FNTHAPAYGKMVPGAARIDQYGAAGRVVTEKSGLRTAQDFHILDIVHVQCGSDRLPEIDAIDKHADGGLDRWNRRVDTKPANREGRIARDRASVVEPHVRGKCRQLRQRADVKVFHLRGPERRNRYGDGLSVLWNAALLGGYEHDLDRLGGILCVGWARKQECGYRGANHRSTARKCSLVISLLPTARASGNAHSQWPIFGSGLRHRNPSDATHAVLAIIARCVRESVQRRRHRAFNCKSIG